MLIDGRAFTITEELVIGSFAAAKAGEIRTQFVVRPNCSISVDLNPEACEAIFPSFVIEEALLTASGIGGIIKAAGGIARVGASELSFGRKLDFLFNRNINQSVARNAARARGNANRIGIADTPANRQEVTRRFNEAFNNPSSIVGPGNLPGSNLREFFLPGVTSTGSKIQFVELDGRVITIIAQ